MLEPLMLPRMPRPRSANCVMSLALFGATLTVTMYALVVPLAAVTV